MLILLPQRPSIIYQWLYLSINPSNTDSAFTSKNKIGMIKHTNKDNRHVAVVISGYIIVTAIIFGIAWNLYLFNPTTEMASNCPVVFILNIEFVIPVQHCPIKTSAGRVGATSKKTTSLIESEIIVFETNGTFDSEKKL